MNDAKCLVFLSHDEALEIMRQRACELGSAICEVESTPGMVAKEECRDNLHQRIMRLQTIIDDYVQSFVMPDGLECEVADGSERLND